MSVERERVRLFVLYSLLLSVSAPDIVRIKRTRYTPPQNSRAIVHTLKRWYTQRHASARQIP